MEEEEEEQKNNIFTTFHNNRPINIQAAAVSLNLNYGEGINLGFQSSMGSVPLAGWRSYESV